MNKMSRIKVIFALLFLLTFFLTASADEKADAVDKLFAPWDRLDTPGCALAVIKDGQIIYERGYGSANLEYNIPITPRSIFYVGSVSKQFVALSIALLAKDGKISLDDDIRKHLPELPDYGKPMTIRHLVHHTSGLRDYLTLLGIAGVDIGTYHENDVLELISRQKELNFRPGEEYLYSNSGYFLLAIIVKKASGKALREFTEENIFRPLGMKDSHFHDEYAELIKDRASGYFFAGKDKYKNFISTFDCVGSGGLFTTVEDLFLWDQNFSHGKVGGMDVIELIQKPGMLNSGKTLNYAFALSLGSYKGLKTVGHGGALGGYRSYIVRFPEENFSVICLSNLNTFNPAKLSLQVADIYLAGQFKEEKTKKDAEKAKEKKAAKISEESIKKMVGAYIEPKTGELIRIFFSAKDKRLISRISDQSFLLEPLKENEFELLDAPVSVSLRFEDQGKGKPLLLHVQQEGDEARNYQLVGLWVPQAEQLAEFGGNYFSEELQMTFRLTLKERKLYFTHKNAPPAPLLPTIKDNFTVRALTIRFIRDQEGMISAFTLNAGRVKNLRFEKKEE